MARLFVALWPDPAVRARLAAFRDAWRWPPGARPVADADLHATLHFVGSVAPERIATLGERLAAVPAREVALRPEGTAVWRGGTAALTLRGDAALAALHDDVGAALHGFGVALDVRPYTPHVTLARKAADAAAPGPLPDRPDLPDLDWRAGAFALVESRPGPPASYRVLAAWSAAGTRRCVAGPGT